MSTVAALQQRIADVGIDLVSCDSEGQLIAIQHKCYAPTATLTKEEIDSFVGPVGPAGARQ
jgi:predicted helicase